MPNLSMFYGIIIYIYLEGSLPQNKKTLVLAWVSIHKDELYANWNLLLNGEPAYKIDPLR